MAQAKSNVKFPTPRKRSTISNQNPPSKKPQSTSVQRPYGQVRRPKGKNVPALVGLILYIIGQIFALIPQLVIACIVATTASLVFGIIGLKKSRKVRSGRSLAIVAIVLSSLSLFAVVLHLLLLASVITFMM